MADSKSSTTLTQCSLCQNFQHCTAAGYCNCGAYGAREGITAPSGYTPVPLEPTPEMLAAWYKIKNGFHYHDEPPPSDTSDVAAYRALLRAAPTIHCTAAQPDRERDRMRTKIRKRYWPVMVVLCLILRGGSPSMAQQLLGPPHDSSPDYKQGWCEGWIAAQKSVMQNRDYYRHRLEHDVPFETHEEAIKRIYATLHKKPDGDSIVSQVVSVVADGIDLYVILPPVKCVIHDGYMSLEFQGSGR